MKGIILAAGRGSRMYPCAQYPHKQLFPVYDKPMIYYPLTTLLENGINDICIITSEEYITPFRRLLGKGSRFGAKITYKIQVEPRGISEAFIIAKKFINKSNVALILGDNIFYGSKVFGRAIKNFEKGGTIFGYKVSDPTRYGVIELDSRNNVLSIEEKPKEPKSDLAIPGFYLFDKQVSDISTALKPSARGELEITDVISAYKDKEELKVVRINRGCAWLDAGTSTALHDSAAFIQTIEHRQNIKVGCPEEAALRNKLISKDDLSQLLLKIPSSEYKDYLSGLL